MAIVEQKLAKIDDEKILASFKVWIDDYNGMTPEKSYKKLEEQVEDLKG